MRVIVLVVAVVAAVAAGSGSALMAQSSQSMLSAQEQAGLLNVLDGEQEAYALYIAVQERIGAVWPFDAIEHAETAHIELLMPLFGRYNIAAPANRWIGNTQPFDSVTAACNIGLQGEIALVGRIETAMAATQHQDILDVYAQILRNNRAHMATFERCLSQTRDLSRPVEV